MTKDEVTKIEEWTRESVVDGRRIIEFNPQIKLFNTITPGGWPNEQMARQALADYLYRIARHFEDGYSMIAQSENHVPGDAPDREDAKP